MSICSPNCSVNLASFEKQWVILVVGGNMDFPGLLLSCFYVSHFYVGHNLLVRSNLTPNPVLPTTPLSLTGSFQRLFPDCIRPMIHSIVLHRSPTIFRKWLEATSSLLPVFHGHCGAVETSGVGCRSGWLGSIFQRLSVKSLWCGRKCWVMTHHDRWDRLWC